MKGLPVERGGEEIEEQGGRVMVSRYTVRVKKSVRTAPQLRSTVHKVLWGNYS